VILPLRRRHLAVFVVLAAIVPAGLVASVAMRAPLPVQEALPEDLVRPEEATEPPDDLSWVREGPLWEELGIETALVPSPGDNPLLAVRPTRDLRAPKVLLYWAAGAGEDEEVPSGAVLLGALVGTETSTFRLPTAMRNRDGRFLVFSLGHQQVLGVWPTRPPAREE